MKIREKGVESGAGDGWLYLCDMRHDGWQVGNGDKIMTKNMHNAFTIFPSPCEFVYSLHCLFIFCFVRHFTSHHYYTSWWSFLPYSLTFSSLIFKTKRHLKFGYNELFGNLIFCTIFCFNRYVKYNLIFISFWVVFIELINIGVLPQWWKYVVPLYDIMSSNSVGD